MSIVAEKPIESNVHADAWKAHSAELAVWMLVHLVNRTDCYGINKPDGDRATGHGKLTVYRLKGHVEARALIGSHLISTDDTCRYIAYDVDAHTDADDYQQNLNTVLDLAARARALGMRALLTDSNGNGGFHLRILFARLIPSADAYNFGIWLAGSRKRGEKDYWPNQTGGIEFYPKRPTHITASGKNYGGNWLRLPGRHHKRKGHWTRVYSFDRAEHRQDPWLEGEEAVAAILATTGNDPALVLDHRVEYTPAPKPEPQRQSPPPPRPASVPGDQCVDRCHRAILRLRTKVSETGCFKLFAAACLCVEYDLTDSEALSLLRRWLTEDPLPHPWTDKDLELKLRDANRRAERGRYNQPGWNNQNGDSETGGGLGNDWEWFGDGLACPDYSNQKPEGNSKSNQDTTNPPQNDSQTVPNPWADFVFSPWDCPKVFGVSMGNNRSAGLFPAACGKHSCPVCGVQWKKETWARFAYHITAAALDGPLFIDCIHLCDREAVKKAMQREAKVRDVPLLYVMFRDDECYLTIIANVPATDMAMEVSLLMALEILSSAIENATTEPRAFSACQAWGPLPDPSEEGTSPEDPWHKVPGGASPQAFVATLHAWNSSEREGRKGFLYSKDDLFLDAIGDFDPSLQADFWREAAIYDDWKSEATEIAKAKAAEFRENGARQRQEERRKQEGPKVDPADCFHDYQERPDPSRPGWLKTTCRICGSVYGSRPAG